MSTSIHDGIVEFSAGLYGAADDPADTVLMRDGVANGLLHAADSYGQVRVSYCPIISTFAGTSRESFATIEASPDADTWYEVGAQPFDQWPITCHADGTPYKLRIRIGTAGSQTKAGVDLTYRVVLAPPGRAREELGRSVDHVYEAVVEASTTIAYATGSSQGSESHATLIELDAATARRWLTRTSIYDAISSGSPTSVEQVLVGAYVFAKCEDGDTLPRVHALHLTEYVGT